MTKYEMKQLAKSTVMQIYHFLTHRILWLMVVTLVLFYILVVRLFELQIILADTFHQPPPETTEFMRTIAPIRGTIYDRHGRPLATNTLTFAITMDPSVSITNEALHELALLFERNGEDYVHQFHITQEAPFEFTLGGSPAREFRWKDDLAVPNPRYATAEETLAHVRQQFNIDPAMSNEDAFRILNFRSMIFIERFRLTPVVLAHDVSLATIAAIEERRDLFTGIYIDIQTLREYPAGIYVSHMLGYIRPINAEDLEANQHLGYTNQDLFGAGGLERSMEHYLRGTPGTQLIQINSARRRVGEPELLIDPIPGDRVFLTIDLELQRAAYYILKDTLGEAIIGRLTLPRNHNEAVTMQEAFIQLIRNHSLNIPRILTAEEGSEAFAMRRYILDRFPHPDTQPESITRIHNLLVEGINTGRISPAMMLLTLIGTEQISDPDGSIALRLRSTPGAALDVIITKIRARELTPQMFNLDPSTASAIITDVHTGAVLAAVTYPSFDNNRLVNTLDFEYFNHIYFLDRTNPAMNRPFQEQRAPGSTFKMFSAVAALEAGTIAPNTRIFDQVAFRAAGDPPVHCWHRGGHGNINVRQAIAVSCNFFFAEAVFRMGNAGPRGRTTLEGIQTLNDYMEFFSLHERSGVEIREARDMFPNGVLSISSPEFKRWSILESPGGNPFAGPGVWGWFDGDTVRTSIGQGLNNYTPAQMVRGMAIIANQGANYPLHLVGHREDHHGNIVMRQNPVPVPQELTVSDSTWVEVIDGMRLVTEPGASGTAVGVFRDFPIRVAGKTGTAEQIQGRFHHSAFGAFAPYENPQIAIYVSVPFGSTLRAAPQISAHMARDLIGEALGLNLQPERPNSINTLRR